MIALDTNVLVRVITRDDPKQARTGAALMRANPLWLSKSVLLETGWVLRYTYGFDAGSIHHALGTLVGLANLQVEDASAVERALGWQAAGLDLADALHLASGGGAERFATFDRKLANAAAALDGAPGLELLAGS